MARSSITGSTRKPQADESRPLPCLPNAASCAIDSSLLDLLPPHQRAIRSAPTVIPPRLPESDPASSRSQRLQHGKIITARLTGATSAWENHIRRCSSVMTVQTVVLGTILLAGLAAAQQTPRAPTGATFPLDNMDGLLLPGKGHVGADQAPRRPAGNRQEQRRGKGQRDDQLGDQVDEQQQRRRWWAAESEGPGRRCSKRSQPRHEGRSRRTSSSSRRALEIEEDELALLQALETQARRRRPRRCSRRDELEEWRRRRSWAAQEAESDDGGSGDARAMGGGGRKEMGKFF